MIELKIVGEPLTATAVKEALKLDNTAIFTHANWGNTKFMYKVYANNTELDDKIAIRELKDDGSIQILTASDNFPISCYSSKDADWYLLDYNKKYNLMEIIHHLGTIITKKSERIELKIVGEPLTSIDVNKILASDPKAMFTNRYWDENEFIYRFNEGITSGHIGFRQLRNDVKIGTKVYISICPQEYPMCNNENDTLKNWYRLEYDSKYTNSEILDTGYIVNRCSDNTSVISNDDIEEDREDN